ALVSDLSQNTLPIKTSMTLENLDLTLLQKDAKTPIKNLAGLMSAALQVSGPILDQNKIKGAANLSIVDGNLGQIIPEFRNTIFNAASADFTIQDGKFKTENATIKSNMLDLKAKGWIDFAKNINFDIAPSSNQPAGDESGRMKLSLPALLEKGFVIKITGSIDNIKYKLEPIPMKILENTTGTVTDVIKTGINILEGLF
ncbi:MAG TPA: AsmA-like C-terminal region-containing protein, partial [Candidatus Omnitrophota bacterium]|nr:AsmA-like C-terminal region-containing protein [Candidatus Omnitrophota bacterium]